MTITIRAGLAGIVAACLISGPASAASCWSAAAADAARVREFQTMLMVRTLRCRAIGADISAAFNGFVTANLVTIETANATLRAQLGDARAATPEYDRFVTVLANSYGDEPTSPSGCEEAAMLAASATDATAGTLLRLATAVLPERALPGARCASRVAEQLAVAEPRALPVADDAPGALPAELAGAMAVLARYGLHATGAAPASAVVAAAH